MKPVLAIDPGLAGGLAWQDRNGIVRAVKMPGGMTSQLDFLRERAAEYPGLTAVLEKVGGYRSHNSGPAACTFARHCGQLDSALYLLGIPTRTVAPQVWMRKIGVPVKLEKAERKRWLKEFAARRYPHLEVTLATSDALALLAWAVESTNF